MKKYLVMIPYSWGIGDTLAAAEKEARKQGGQGRKKLKRLAWKFDPAKTECAYIDDVGALCWKGEKPERIDL